MLVEPGAHELRRQETVRLLLVEDSADDAELIRTKLAKSERINVDVTHVDRLGKALERLSGDDFDVVLLDFSLPDSFGMETFRRAHAAAPRIPIIVLTSVSEKLGIGFSREEVKTHYGHAPEAFLEKPFEPQSFLNTVKRVYRPRSSA